MSRDREAQTEPPEWKSPTRLRVAVFSGAMGHDVLVQRGSAQFCWACLAGRTRPGGGAERGRVDKKGGGVRGRGQIEGELEASK